MFENTKSKLIDKSPVRIRPPDEGEGKRASTPGQSWPEDLSIPKRDDLPRWLSVEQVRKMQRMRRETVIEAMRTGELPFEKRGRICYIRLSDVVLWEERRLQPNAARTRLLIHPALLAWHNLIRSERNA